MIDKCRRHQWTEEQISQPCSLLNDNSFMYTLLISPITLDQSHSLSPRHYQFHLHVFISAIQDTCPISREVKHRDSPVCAITGAQIWDWRELWKLTVKERRDMSNHVSFSCHPALFYLPWLHLSRSLSLSPPQLVCRCYSTNNITYTVHMETDEKSNRNL